MDFDLKKKYDFNSIEIVRKYEEPVPGVLCESGKIQQVVINILRNGAEAMSEIQRDPQFILRIIHDKTANMVKIEIEDNGPGMSDEVSRRIFEPFYTTKKVGEGTGLGLSVSYFIITENHRGQMRVHSEPGRGTTFVIALPV